jgi:hypothetical protein
MIEGAKYNVPYGESDNKVLVGMLNQSVVAEFPHRCASIDISQRHKMAERYAAAPAASGPPNRQKHGEQNAY